MDLHILGFSVYRISGSKAHDLGLGPACYMGDCAPLSSSATILTLKTMSDPGSPVPKVLVLHGYVAYRDPVNLRACYNWI